jgi:hypothetical protein
MKIYLKFFVIQNTIYEFLFIFTEDEVMKMRTLYIYIGSNFILYLKCLIFLILI